MDFPTNIRIIGLALFLTVPCTVLADSPAFPEQVSSILKKDEWGVQAPPQKEDVLLRRLYLTLNGVPPRYDELVTYLEQPDPAKYERLVDELLSRPEFVEHWAEKLDVMLMERRGNAHIPQDQWSQWLREQIQASKPIHHLMSELLTADGSPGANRPAARFLLDRLGDPHLMTRDIGRIYFGRDMQCAQCHDHPSVSGYFQQDYHGLFSFVSTIGLQEITEGDKKLQMIAEKSPGDAPFESVFSRGNMHRVLPNLFGAEELDQPWTVPGEDYHPAEQGRPAKPLHSRRTQLAELIRSGQSVPFNRNLANRLWALVMGRGITEPLDWHHSNNPPLSGELLDLVTHRLVSTGFDLRTFLRELVLLDVFKQGSMPVDFRNSSDPEWLATPVSLAQQRVLELDNRINEAIARTKAASDEFKRIGEIVAPVERERLTAFGQVDSARTAYAQSLDAVNKAKAEKDKSEQPLHVAKDKQTKLQTALDASSLALAAIGQDAELTAAIELLKTRVAAAQAAIPPLEQAFIEKSNAHQAAITASQASKANLIAAQTQADVINAKYKREIVPLRNARIAMESAEEALASLIATKQHASKIADWAKLRDETNTTNVRLQVAKVDREGLQTQLVQYQTQLGAMETKMGALTSASQSAEQVLNEAKSQIALLDQKIQTVSNAEANLGAASALVANRDALSTAVAELQSSMGNLKSERAKAEQTLTGMLAEMEIKQKAVLEQQNQLAQLRQQTQATQEKIETLTQQLATDEATSSNLRSQRIIALQAIQNTLSERFHLSRVMPLSPEQIGWSFLATNHVYNNYVQKHFAELEKESPATAEQQQDPNFRKARMVTAVRKARAELQGNINLFVTLYGAGPGQPQFDFFATADQALYASNGGALFAWATPSGDNVAQRIVQATDPKNAANILYRGVLCREPIESEVQATESFLNQAPDQRARLVQEMVWSLMASAEFRFLQ